MKILIVVDMQYDFVTGNLGSQDAIDIIPVIVDKIQHGNYNKIYLTKDIHDSTVKDTVESANIPEHCLEHSMGSMILREISESLVQRVYDRCENEFPDRFLAEDFSYFKKHTFAANWIDVFKEYTEADVEICGVCTDICVISNALAIRSLSPRVKISVDSKACAGTSPEAHEAALTVMRNCCIDIL